MSDTELPPHPVFRNDGDQLTMMMALLDCFPGQAGSPNVLVPIHPRVRRAWAETLIKRGMVVVPQLMQELPVSTGTHPEAAWLQPQRWVARKDYTAETADQQAQAPAATDEQVEAQLKDLLRATKPALLDDIEATMRDPEARAAMAERLRPQAMAGVDAIQAALEQAARGQTKGDDDVVDG